MDEATLIKYFYDHYSSLGENRFYRFLLGHAMVKLPAIKDGSYKGVTPDIELLLCHDKFMVLYRRTGEDDYINMARLFRRAGHRIYRVMLKVGMTDRNLKFLNMV